jgi:uncharacterized protein (DUF1330 family)
MSVYLIADIKVTNPDWVPAYAGNVHNLVARHGGRYLSRSGRITALEGPESDSTLIALLEFPDQAAFQAFAADPEYAPYGAARQAGSRSIFTLIDDTDIAGAISYLPKG